MAQLQKIKDGVAYADAEFYSAFPALISLKGGGAMAVFRRAPEINEFTSDQWGHIHPNSHLVQIKWDGESWSEPSLQSHNPIAGDQSSSMLRLQDGRILFWGFSWRLLTRKTVEAAAEQGIPLEAHRSGFGTEAVSLGAYFQTSQDDGLSWSERVWAPEIPDSHAVIPGYVPYRGYATGSGVELPDGQILVARFGARALNNRDIRLMISRDGGATWENGAVIATGTDDVPKGEPALLRSPSGKITCFIRTTINGDYLYTSESTDDGLSWSEVKRRNVVGHPYNVISLRDGRVLLCYGYRHEPHGLRCRLLKPELEDLDDAEEFVIRDDGGGFDLGYPWACQLEDGKILVVYYFHTADNPIRRIEYSLLQVGARED